MRSDSENAVVKMLYYGWADGLRMFYFLSLFRHNLDDMAILRNPKWERFAQELAGGRTAGQAYEISGFCANPANAWRLHQREEIRRRIDEILDQKQRAADKAVENAAEKAGLDTYWVMRTLRRNSVLAARRGDTAASNRAAELIGRHLGMFIEKKEFQINLVDDSDAYLARLLQLVQVPVLEAEPLKPGVLLTHAEHDTEDGQKNGSDETPATETIDIVEEVG
jgi:phage terminase small subunit